MTRLTKEDFFALAVIAVAIGFRFMDLSLRPFHHDEGVNGFFLGRLLNEGAFKYDPSNYHGPTLYYLTAPMSLLFGLSDASVRGTTALFGVLTVIVLWRFLSRERTAFGLAAALLLAVSPGAVFFSRYFIHETLFVGFTLFALASAPFAGNAQRWRFIVCGVMLGLLFATKETAFVSALAVGGGVVMANWLVSGRSPLAILDGLPGYVRAHAEEFLHGFLSFAATAGLLYSSFFRNPQGVLDAFRTFMFWTKTAVRDHENPWNQHLLWLKEADPVLLFLGCAGALVALALRRSFIGVTAAVWAILIGSAYSIVKYKTPWLGLNILLPLAICAGYLVSVIADVVLLSGRLPLRSVAAVFAIAAAGYSATMSYDLETKRFDDENHPYLYAHTQRSFIEFVHLVETKARMLGRGKDTNIAVFAPENWPLPWYLRDYKNTGYWGEFKSEIEADLFVVSVEQDPVVAMKLGGKYDRSKPFNMRGSVNLILYSKTLP